ncbi:hypothetical protein UWK_01345 [Desulfocapsa sulfexigens DSM 10523]|uniref:Uncharacterized protein n=1 Tax=Desulfocapsa sulfexigens (strain DSM 10523 / SB164P1) TaxID=1167006 RepID=M1PN93_DESSD|nr:hypothetical protein UWK_01345 [Desulfocapsa sulfexigens DSM 10523]
MGRIILRIILNILFFSMVLATDNGLVCVKGR